jgi:hypothetical protein
MVCATRAATTLSEARFRFGTILRRCTADTTRSRYPRATADNVVRSTRRAFKVPDTIQNACQVRIGAVITGLGIQGDAYAGAGTSTPIGTDGSAEVTNCALNFAVKKIGPVAIAVGTRAIAFDLAILA